MGTGVLVGNNGVEDVNEGVKVTVAVLDSPVEVGEVSG